MNPQWAEAAGIETFHAHVYYEEKTRPIAAELRAVLEERFEVVMGRWREMPVGPHPLPMYQVAFARAEFTKILPFLMLNRRGLSILVHPNTADAYEDHASHAVWLGTPLPLHLEFLRPR